MSSKKRAGGYEACRDLSGRRIRTVNQAKLVDEYMKRKNELEATKQAEIRAKMEKAIHAPNQKAIFQDTEYIQQLRNIADETELATNEALFGEEEEVLDLLDPHGKLPVNSIRPASSSQKRK